MLGNNLKANLSREERIDRVVVEFLEKEEAGEHPDPLEWLSRHPELRSALGTFFRNHQALRRVEEGVHAQPAPHDLHDRGLRGIQVGSVLPELVHPGEVVGDCRIIQKLGQGGMGVVYQAVHVRLDDLRAVKFLPREDVTDAMIQRFWREARTAASIKHPNVIKIHDVGQEGELHYIVMEYVEGKTLSELRESEVARSPDRLFSWTTAARLMIPVLDALHAVHRRGLVHRDVKPSNVMVTLASKVARKSHVVLMDFGLVQDESDALVTQSGAIVGTPAYMSREQALGWEIDERSDVFAVGATLYFLLTGRHPHEASKSVVLARAAAGIHPIAMKDLRPDLPPEVHRIVERAMAPDRDCRFAHAEEMLNGLTTLLRGTAEAVPRRSGQPETRHDISESRPPTALEETVTYHPDTKEDHASLEAVPLQLLPPRTELSKMSRGLQFLDSRLKVANVSVVGVVVAALLLVVAVGGFLLWNHQESRGPEDARVETEAATMLEDDASKYEGMVLIPAGIVHLGASRQRLHAHAMTLDLIKGSQRLIQQFVAACTEEPPETVHVQGFWIDKYEVTNAEYADFIKATGRALPPRWQESRPPAEKDDHPVTNVRYSDAAAYAAWVGKQLPTIAQWTRAFRGGDDRMYPWGNEWKPERANVAENTSFPLDTSSVQASPLDETQFGVRNMVGNVSEIVRERTLKDSQITTITKGGESEANGAIYGAAPFRFFLIGENTTHTLTGFRCVIEE